MPRGRKSKLRARERRRRSRAEARVRGAQAAAGAAGAAVGPPPAVPGAAAPRGRGQAPRGRNPPWAPAAEGPAQDLLAQKAAALVEYLLHQYQAREPARRGDMLRVVHKRYRKDFPDILARAAGRLELLFGLRLQEARPRGGSFLLVDQRGDAGDGRRCPPRGILLPLLSVIFLNGGRASEEEIWALLGALGVYDGKSDFVFGEPRKLVTQDLVQERYLVSRPAPGSDPPRREFLWGPRAQAETSKMKVLEFVAKLHDTVPAAFAPHYEEALRDEEERARGRARPAPAPGPAPAPAPGSAPGPAPAPAPASGPPPKASGCPGAASCRHPAPE